MGLIGSPAGIVEVRLVRPRRTRIVLCPYTYNRVFVSMCDPSALLADLDLLALCASQAKSSDWDSWR